MSDLRDLGERGFLSRVPHFNSVLNAMENPGLAPVLTAMIEESAGPLRAVETDFAVDSSGFSSSVYERWYSEKYGKEKSKVRWIKAHLMVGTKTNIVTSAEVTHSSAHDSRFLEPLLHASMQRFDVKRLSADKAYSSVRLLGRIHDAGAMPLIPFKYNATGRATSYPNRESADIWAKMYHFYMYHRDEFLGFYHRRSNVETTFSMIKAKFGTRIRSKTQVAQLNEVLCKVLAHNLCCLVQSMYELGSSQSSGKPRRTGHYRGGGSSGGSGGGCFRGDPRCSEFFNNLYHSISVKPRKLATWPKRAGLYTRSISFLVRRV